MARTSVLGTCLTCFALVLSSAPAMAAQPPLAGAQPSFGVAGLNLIAPEQGDMEAARAAYDEGEQAYRLGKFEEAALAFERAYELSDLPDILYNIGLSHLRWYDIDPDLAHLRKAKVVFQNYVIEIQKDPELGDLEEAEELIAQIDEKIAAAESAADDDEPPPPAIEEPVDHGPDPGKKLRLGGAISMGVGGALVVGGVVAAVVLGAKSQQFEEELDAAYRIRDEDLGCTPTDARAECDAINAEIEVHRSNGRQANALAAGLGVSLGGVGLIGIVAGAVVFVQGNKKTKAWESKQLSLAPIWSPHMSGLSLSGKF